MAEETPSMRITGGIHLHDRNSNIQDLSSFSLGVTQAFEGIAGSLARSRVSQEIRSKFRNDPIKMQQLEKELSLNSNGKEQEAKDNGSKQLLNSTKKRKSKETGSSSNKSKTTDDVDSTTMHAEQTGEDEITFRNISPISMELAILQLPPEFVQTDDSPPQIPPAHQYHDHQSDDDDDFQDSLISRLDKGKEKMIGSSSPPIPLKKRLRSSVVIPQKMIQQKVIPKPSNKMTVQQYVTARAPPTKKKKLKPPCVVLNKPADRRPKEQQKLDDKNEFRITRDEFDSFKLFIKEEFEDIRKLIKDNFKAVLKAINDNKSVDKINVDEGLSEHSNFFTPPNPAYAECAQLETEIQKGVCQDELMNMAAENTVDAINLNENPWNVNTVDTNNRDVNSNEPNEPPITVS